MNVVLLSALTVCCNDEITLLFASRHSLNVNPVFEYVFALIFIVVSVVLPIVVDTSLV